MSSSNIWDRSHFRVAIGEHEHKTETFREPCRKPAKSYESAVLSSSGPCSWWEKTDSPPSTQIQIGSAV